MQVFTGDTGPCLLLLLLLCWLLPDRKFASIWDLVEGFLYHVLFLVAVYACDAQCCKGRGSCKGIHVQLC